MPNTHLTSPLVLLASAKAKLKAAKTLQDKQAALQEISELQKLVFRDGRLAERG
jgi:hypothetical protein